MRMIFVTIFLSALIACSSFEVKSVEDGIALGYSNVITISQSAAAAHDDMVITDEQADNVKSNLQEAKDKLDLATRLLDTGRTGPANTRLEQSQVILQAVIALLKEAEE